MTVEADSHIDLETVEDVAKNALRQMYNPRGLIPTELFDPQVEIMIGTHIDSSADVLAIANAHVEVARLKREYDPSPRRLHLVR